MHSMYSSYLGKPDREDGLIVDVYPPRQRGGFDIRQPVVRHQPIGQLDEAYRYSQSWESDNEGSGGGLQLAYEGFPASGAYTRVPPLQTLPHWLEHPLELQSLGYNFKSLATAAGRRTKKFLTFDILGAADWVMSRLRIVADAQLITHKYTLERGVRPDWNKRTLLERLVPLVVIAGCLAILVASLLTTSESQRLKPGHQAPAVTGTRSAPAVQTRPAGSGTGANHQSPSVTSGDAPIINQPLGSQTSAGSTAGTSSTGPSGGTVTGGMGGGSGSSTPTSSGSTATSGSSGGSTTPTSLIPTPTTTTVTVPSSSVQAGGKQLLNTSSTSVTVN